MIQTRRLKAAIKEAREIGKFNHLIKAIGKIGENISDEQCYDDQFAPRSKREVIKEAMRILIDYHNSKVVVK